MKNIFIDPSKSEIAFKVTPLSLHVIGFEILVIDSDQNTVLEKYPDKTSNDEITVLLNNPPVYYKGKYISGTFTFISPNGDDYMYKATFSILTDNMEVNPALTITGKTGSGQAITVSTFKVV